LIYIYIVIADRKEKLLTVKDVAIYFNEHIFCKIAREKYQLIKQLEDNVLKEKRWENR